MMDGKQLMQEFIDRFNAIINEKPYTILVAEVNLNTHEPVLAQEILSKMHNAFCEVYGSRIVPWEVEYISVPAIVCSKNTGYRTLALLDLDVDSGGEHIGTTVLDRDFGLIDMHSAEEKPEARNTAFEKYSPYAYYYTVEFEDDLHTDRADWPDDIKQLIDFCHKNEPAPTQGPVDQEL